MKKIRFSHDYKKFEGLIHTKDPLSDNMKVLLLNVLKINYKDLSGEMIKYDAEYKGEYGMKMYELPKGDLILLIFQTNYGKIFTTIRRYTKEKWDYYKKSEGEIFKLEIEGKK